MNEGAGRRWVRRVGSPATVRTFTRSGADDYGDPTSYGPVEVATSAVVVERGMPSVFRDAKGAERQQDADIFIPDDVTLPDLSTVDDFPEIEVRGDVYEIGHVGHEARPGIHHLLCELLRRRT